MKWNIYTLRTVDGRKIDYGVEEPNWKICDDLFIRYTNGPLAGQIARPGDRVAISNGKYEVVMPPHL